MERTLPISRKYFTGATLLSYVKGHRVHTRGVTCESNHDFKEMCLDFSKKKKRNALKDWFSGFIAKPISKVI